MISKLSVKTNSLSDSSEKSYLNQLQSSLKCLFFKKMWSKLDVCTVRKLASQSLVTGYRKDTDDSEILRQEEPLWLITTTLLKIPVY